MDEAKFAVDLYALLNEMWVFVAAIWCTTKLFGDAVPQIPNRLFAVLVAIVYGVGAHLSGYLPGGWFVVLAVKTPIAAIFAHLSHEYIYNTFKKGGAEAIKNIVEGVKKNGNGNDNNNINSKGDNNNHA